MSQPKITPRLIVTDPDAAIAFYCEAMGGELLERFKDESRGLVVHAAVQLGESVLALAQEHREWGNDAPGALGGSPVRLEITVDDADALGRAMVARGAEVVIPIEDRFYGHREGRLRDPFGHLWIVSQIVEELSPEEVARRMAEL